MASEFQTVLKFYCEVYYCVVMTLVYVFSYLPSKKLSLRKQHGILIFFVLLLVHICQSELTTSPPPEKRATVSKRLVSYSFEGSGTTSNTNHLTEAIRDSPSVMHPQGYSMLTPLLVSSPLQAIREDPFTYIAIFCLFVASIVIVKLHQKIQHLTEQNNVLICQQSDINGTKNPVSQVNVHYHPRSLPSTLLPVSMTQSLQGKAFYQEKARVTMNYKVLKFSSWLHTWSEEKGRFLKDHDGCPLLYYVFTNPESYFYYDHKTGLTTEIKQHIDYILTTEKEFMDMPYDMSYESLDNSLHLLFRSNGCPYPIMGYILTKLHTINIDLDHENIVKKTPLHVFFEHYFNSVEFKKGLQAYEYKQLITDVFTLCPSGINQPDKYKKTPLKWFFQKFRKGFVGVNACNLFIMKKFMWRGADPHTQDDLGNTVFHLIAKKSDRPFEHIAEVCDAVKLSICSVIESINQFDLEVPSEIIREILTYTFYLRFPWQMQPKTSTPSTNMLQKQELTGFGKVLLMKNDDDKTVIDILNKKYGSRQNDIDELKDKEFCPDLDECLKTKNNQVLS